MVVQLIELVFGYRKIQVLWEFINLFSWRSAMKKMFLLCLLVFSMATAVSAKILYQDDFSGDSGTLLDGQAPDIAPGDEVWLAGDDIAANGVATYDGTVYGDSAYLPFNFETGKLYVLTVEFTNVSSSVNTDDWVGVGFTETTEPANRFMETGVHYWALSRYQTNNDQAFLGVRTNEGLGNSSTTGARTLTITIDTVDPANWEVTFDFAGLDTLSGTDTTPATGVNYVSFTTCRTNMEITFFQLEEYSFSSSVVYPLDGDDSIEFENLTLDWDAPDSPTIDPNIGGFNVSYVAYDAATAPAEPNYLDATVVTAADSSYGPVSLGKDKLVYWKVDTVLNFIDSETGLAPVIAGDTWSFYTITTAPTMESISAPVFTYPASNTEIDPATGTSRYQGNVILTCEFTSFSPVTESDVVWTNSTTGVVYSDTTFTADGVNYVSTVTISDITEADQGVYTCTATAGSNSSTASVDVLVYDLISGFTFDSDLTDSISGITAVESGSAVELTGGAVMFDGTNALELGTTGAGYPKAGLGNGLPYGTVNFWVKIDALADGMPNAMLMGVVNGEFRAEGDYDWIDAMQMWVDSGSVNFRVRGYVNGTVGSYHASAALSKSIIGDNEWHMITASYAAGSSIQLYLDGEAAGSAVSLPSNIVINAWDYPVMIGANYDRNLGANGNIVGGIADFKVFNYDLDVFEIVDLYVDVVPDASFCLLGYESEFDFVNDCKIDVQDFAIFAIKWLDCGYYPASGCN